MKEHSIVTFHSLFFVPLYAQVFDKLFDNQKDEMENMIDFTRDVITQISSPSQTFAWIEDNLIDKLFKKMARKALRLSKVQKVMKHVFSVMRGYAIKISPKDLRGKWVREDTMDKNSVSYIFDIDFIYDIVLPFLYARLDRMIWDEKDEATQMVMLTEMWAKQGESYPSYFKPLSSRELREYVEKQWNLAYSKYAEQMVNNNAKKQVQDAYKEYVQGNDLSDAIALAAPILENSSRVRLLGRIVLAAWFVPMKTLQQEDMFEGMPEDVREMVKFFHDLPFSITREDAYKLPPLPKTQLSGDAFLRFVHRSVTGRDVHAEWTELYEKAAQEAKRSRVSHAIEDFYAASGQDKGSVNVKMLYDKYAQLKKDIREDDVALQDFLTYAARVIIPMIIMPYEEAVKKQTSSQNTSMNKKIRRDQVASVHTLFFTPLYIEVFHDMFPQEKSQKDAMVALMRHVIGQLSQREQAGFDWLDDFITDPIIMHIDDDAPISLTFVQNNIDTVLQRLGDRAIKISPVDLSVSMMSQESPQNSVDALFQIDFFYDLLFPFMYARLYQSRENEKYTNEQYFDIVEQWIKKSTEVFTLPIHPHEIEDYMKAVWKDIYEREKGRLIDHNTREQIQQAFDEFMRGQENIDIAPQIWDASYTLRSIGRALFSSWFVSLEILKDVPFFRKIPKDAQRLVAFFHHLPESLSHFLQYDLPAYPAQQVSRDAFADIIRSTIQGADDNAAFKKHMAEIIRASHDDVHVQSLLKEMRRALFEDSEVNAELHRLTRIKDAFEKLDDLATNLPPENAYKSMMEKLLDKIAQHIVPSLFVLKKDILTSPIEEYKKDEQQEHIASVHTLFFIPLYVQIFDRLFPRDQSHKESMLLLIRRIAQEQILDGVCDVLEKTVIQVYDDSPIYLEHVQKTVSMLFDALKGDALKISPIDFSIKRVSSPTTEKDYFTPQSLFEIDFVYDILLPFLYTRLSRIRVREWKKSRQYLLLVREWLQRQNQKQSGDTRTQTYTIPVDHAVLTQYMKRVLEDVYTKAREDLVDAHMEKEINRLYSFYVQEDESNNGIENTDTLKKSIYLRFIGRLVLGFWFVPLNILQDQMLFRQVPQQMRALISFYHEFPRSVQDPESYGAASFPIKRVDEKGIEAYLREEANDMDILSEWKKITQALQQRVDDIKQDTSAQKDAMQRAVQSLYAKTTQTSAPPPLLDELMKDYQMLEDLAQKLDSNNLTHTLHVFLSFANQKLIPYIYILRNSSDEGKNRIQNDQDQASIHTMFFIPLYTLLFNRVFPKNMSTRESMLNFTQYVIDSSPSDAPLLDWLGDIVMEKVISRVDQGGTLLSLRSIQDGIQQMLQKLDGYAIRIHPEDLSVKWISPKEDQALTASGLFDIDYVYDILLPFLFTRLDQFTWNDMYEREHIMSLIQKWLAYKKQSGESSIVSTSFALPIQKKDFQSFMEEQWHGVYEKYKENNIDTDTAKIVSQAYAAYTSSQKSTHKSMTRKILEASTLVRTVGRMMLGFWFIPLEELQKQQKFQGLPREGKMLVDFFHNFPTSSASDTINIPKSIIKTVSPTAFVTFVDKLVGNINVMEKWNDYYLMAFRYVHRAKEKSKDPARVDFYTTVQSVLNDLFVQTTSPELPDFEKVGEKYDMLKYQVEEVRDGEARRILEGVLEFVSRSVLPFLFVLLPEGIRDPRKESDGKTEAKSDDAQENRLEEMKRLADEMKKIKEDFEYAYFKVMKQKNEKDSTHDLDLSSRKTQYSIEEVKRQIHDKTKKVKEKKEKKARIEEYILKNARFLERRYDRDMRGLGIFGRLDNHDVSREKIKDLNTELDILNQEIDNERDEIDKLREKLEKLEREGRDTVKKELSEKELVIESIDKSLTQNQITIEQNYDKAKEHLGNFQRSGNRIFLEKIEFLFRQSRKFVEESREMVDMWKKQENIEVGPGDRNNKKEMTHLQEQWENELDRKERELIKQEKKIRGDKQCLSWREKVGRRFSPEFNIDAFEIMNNKIDNFQRRLKPFEENTNTDLARFINDAFQYVNGLSNTKDGLFNVLAEESFKNAYKRAIAFGYRAINRYRRFHFDFIMKRIRRELDYLKFWRETPGYKESVDQYGKYFDKVDTRLKNTAEQAQQFLLTDFEKTFSRNMERFDLANIVDNTERMDFLLYQRQVISKASQLAKLIQSEYFDQVNIIQMLVDRRFLLSIALNVVSFGLFFMAMHWGEKTYKDTYKRNNYAQNPPLLLFTGSTMAYYVIMQVGVIALLSGFYIYNFDTYYIDANFIYNFATEQGFQALVFGSIAMILTSVCQNVSLFRYDQEALRGFRALKQMLISICIVLFIIPLFYLL